MIDTAAPNKDEDVDRFANEYPNNPTDDKDTIVGRIYDTPTDGIFQVYWPNDNLRYEWYYKNGKRADGVSKSWWPNGNLKSKHTLKDWEYDELYTTWYDNGQKEYESTYKNGIKVGLWTHWYSNGQKESEGTFNVGEDVWHFWYENGQEKLEVT